MFVCVWCVFVCVWYVCVVVANITEETKYADAIKSLGHYLMQTSFCQQREK